MRARLGPDDEVRSAGMAASEGDPIASKALEVLKEKGLTLNTRARGINQKLILWADKILCIEPRHAMTMLLDHPIALGKVFSLAAWAKEPSVEIPDPFGGTIEEYRETRDLLDRLIAQGLGQ